MAAAATSTKHSLTWSEIQNRTHRVISPENRDRDWRVGPYSPVSGTWDAPCGEGCVYTNVRESLTVVVRYSGPQPIDRHLLSATYNGLIRDFELDCGIKILCFPCCFPCIGYQCYNDCTTSKEDYAARFNKFVDETLEKADKMVTERIAAIQAITAPAVAAASSSGASSSSDRIADLERQLADQRRIADLETQVAALQKPSAPSNLRQG